MKYYTPNRQISPKAQNVMLRILFIIIAAAVIKLASRKSNIYGSDSVISYMKTLSGNSMVVQRLRLGTFTAGTLV